MEFRKTFGRLLNRQITFHNLIYTVIVDSCGNTTPFLTWHKMHLAKSILFFNDKVKLFLLVGFFFLTWPLCHVTNNCSRKILYIFAANSCVIEVYE